MPRAVFCLCWRRGIPLAVARLTFQRSLLTWFIHQLRYILKELLPLRTPDFICIGAQRSGTTWLDKHLRRQPGIWLPPLKELHYFDVADPTVNVPTYRYVAHLKSRAKRYVAAALSPLLGHCIARRIARHELRLNPKWDFKYFFGVATDKWYASLFSEAKKLGNFVGEIAPGYSLLSPEFIGRIRAINPDIKMIFIMRNPIDRSWSQATKDLCRRTGLKVCQIPNKTFIDFIYRDKCKLRSDYVRTLKNWEAEFDEKQMLIVFYDDICDQPAEFLDRIVGFITNGAKKSFVGRDLSERVNVSASGLEKIPRQVEVELAKIHIAQLEQLGARFGAPAKKWHEGALRVLA